MATAATDAALERRLRRSARASQRGQPPLLRGRGGPPRCPLPPDGRAVRAGRPPARARATRRAARSDARHVAVEFVHPVIVGKRALPAIALAGEGGSLGRPARRRRRARGHRHRLRRRGGPRRRRLDGGGAGARAWLPDDRLRRRPGPSGSWSRPRTDPFVRQELVETAYHVLWELVHVFFEHRGLLAGRASGPGPRRRAPQASSTRSCRRASAISMRWSRTCAARRWRSRRRSGLSASRLWRRTATSSLAAAAAIRRSFEAGGTLLAFGNGGSATDAMDLVADLRAAPQGWPERRAIDLTEDPSILTAIANDVGVEEIFQRQLIAHGREGDVAVALSTSGNSLNLIEALAEARRRRLTTVAFVGDDGGRIAAEGPRRPRRRHPLSAHPEDPGGAGERLPRAARADRARRAGGLMERRVAARVSGTVQGVGFRPFAYRLAEELELGGFVLNDERGVAVEVEGDPERVGEFLRRLAADAPSLARVEAVEPTEIEATGERRFQILASERSRGAGGAGLARHRDLRRLPGRAVRPRGPPLPLPVHQLHQLRPTVHDRPRRPLRPRRDDDGRLRDVRGLPRRVRGPGGPPLPRPAERLPGLRAAGPAGRGRRGADRPRRSTPTRSPPPWRCWPAARSSRSRGSAATTSPAAPPTSARSPSCGGASTATSKPFALIAPDLDAAREPGRAGRRRGASAQRARAADRHRPASGRRRGRRRGRAPLRRPRGDAPPLAPAPPAGRRRRRAARADLGQRLRGADRPPRRGGARAARLDRRRVPAPRPPDSQLAPRTRSCAQSIPSCARRRS